MSCDSLSALLSSLELGTKLHISVVFSEHFGNAQTMLPLSQRIHQCPVCDAAKSTPAGYAACLRCRNTVLRAVRQRQKSLSGFCVKGVYEYCHPVLRNGKTAAVIFVGNLLTDSRQQLSRLCAAVPDSLLASMEQHCTPEHCAQIAHTVDSYIQLLMEKYGDHTTSGTNDLIENVKAYIQEHLLYDFSMSQLSAAFGYNQKYLGRLFKSDTGQSIRQYCNTLKLKNAATLLRHTQLSITQIAAQAGYNNVTHFNRIFRQQFGISPGIYRKKGLSQNA